MPNTTQKNVIEGANKRLGNLERRDAVSDRVQTSSPVLGQSAQAATKVTETWDRLGAELELLLEKDGKPLEWKDWPKLLEVVRQTSTGNPHPKVDRLTGELLGYEIPGKGIVTCDSSASQAELALNPERSKSRALSNLDYLHGLLKESMESIGGSIRWGSQYPGPITEEGYWRRVARKGVYTVVRREWKWKHYEMHLSAAFQPAIDINPPDAAGYLNAIHATSPLSIVWLGGSVPAKGNANVPYYEYRMHGWTRMVPGDALELKMLGVRHFSSNSDYIDSLLGLRSRVIALAGDDKSGRMAYFDHDITGKDVVAGATAHRIDRIIDWEKDRLEISDMRVSGAELINKMDWWTFWDSRWRFNKTSNGGYTKSYIEVRNIGTPSSYDKLEQIMDYFIMLRRESESVNALAEKHGAWRNIDAARESAIRYGKLPKNHMDFLESLRSNGIIACEKLHGRKT